MGPYIGLGILLLAIWVVVASRKSPKIIEEFPDAGDTSQLALARTLWHNKRYRFGVVAQFFNVAAQVCTWTFLLQYVQQAIGGSLQLGGFLLQVSLIIFLLSRFLMTWVIGKIRATKVLAALAILAILLCLYAMGVPNITGVIAVVSISFCLSLMFPTIYGVALHGLGPATKLGAAGLVMAIVGGAIMPVVQGALLDATSAAISFIVPALCFAVVAAFAIYDLRAKEQPPGRDSKGRCSMSVRGRLHRRRGPGRLHHDRMHDRPRVEQRAHRPSSRWSRGGRQARSSEP